MNIKRTTILRIINYQESCKLASTNGVIAPTCTHARTQWYQTATSHIIPASTLPLRVTTAGRLGLSTPSPRMVKPWRFICPSIGVLYHRANESICETGWWNSKGPALHITGTSTLLDEEKIDENFKVKVWNSLGISFRFFLTFKVPACCFPYSIDGICVCCATLFQPAHCHKEWQQWDSQD